MSQARQESVTVVWGDAIDEGAGPSLVAGGRNINGGSDRIEVFPNVRLILEVSNWPEYLSQCTSLAKTVRQPLFVL